MRIIKALVLATLIFCVFPHRLYAQNSSENDLYSIISVVINSINSEIPIVDTIAPVAIRSKLLREKIGEKICLTSRQKRRLKKTDKKDKGFVLNRELLSDFKFKDYKIIYDMLIQSSLKGKLVDSFEQERPFYFVGKPIIFDDKGIAILDIDLVGSFGAIYILKKENGKWSILADVGKWYS